MNERNLDQLITIYRERVLLNLPGSFQQDVRREIRRRKSESFKRSGSWFNWILEPLLDPKMTFAALAFAMLLGVGMGTTASSDTRNIQTRSALNLQVFSVSSVALPATLLGYSQ